MAYTDFESKMTRKLVVKASDRAIADAEWLLTMGPEGVEMRKLGDDEEYFLSWRSIIGHALIHRAKKGRV
jgi:hypothetical protein